MSNTTAPHQKASLIGSEMDSVPYLSPFGRLYRLSRLNSIWLNQFPYMFGIPAPLQYALLTGGRVPWEDLHAWDENSLTEDSRIRCEWRDWYPYKNGIIDRTPAKLRGCPACFSYGYHTMLHQLPWIISCPWHRERLIDACSCGRNLMPTSRKCGAVQLLACPCGKDYYDRSSALLGMERFPTSEVRHYIDAHLSFSRDERTRTSLITSPSSTLDEAYAWIEPMLRSPYRPSDAAQKIARKGNEPLRAMVFDDSTDEPWLTDATVSAIIKTWWTTPFSCAWESRRIPVTPSCYGKILKQANVTNLEALRRFGICDLLDISANDVYSMRRLVAEGDSKDHPFPRVDGGVIGAQRGSFGVVLFDLVCPYSRNARSMCHFSPDSHATEQALIRWSKTPHARILARALSEFTTLMVIEYLKKLLLIAPVIKDLMHYRLDFGKPIILVRDAPELRIVVGLARANALSVRTHSLHWMPSRNA